MISRGNVSIKSSPLILALILILPACSSPRPYEDIDATNALFAERCKNQAGIKVYKKIPNVEGVFLEKIRPDRAGVELKDPLNPGAAFSHEVGGRSISSRSWVMSIHFVYRALRQKTLEGS